jgi:hypothetical protein
MLALPIDKRCCTSNLLNPKKIVFGDVVYLDLLGIRVLYLFLFISSFLVLKVWLIFFSYFLNFFGSSVNMTNFDISILEIKNGKTITHTYTYTQTH